MKFRHTEHRQPACCFEPGPACCASLPEPRGIRSPLSRSILANPSLQERAGGPVSMFRPATRRQNRYTEYPGAVCPRDAPPCRWLRTRGSSRTFPQVSCRRLMRVPPHRHQIRLLTNRTVSIHWRALLPPCFGCGGRAPITLIAARLQHLRRWLPNPAEDLRDRIAPRPCCPGHAPSSPKGTRPPLGLPVPA